MKYIQCNVYEWSIRSICVMISHFYLNTYKKLPLNRYLRSKKCYNNTYNIMFSYLKDLFDQCVMIFISNWINKSYTSKRYWIFTAYWRNLWISLELIYSKLLLCLLIKKFEIKKENKRLTKTNFLCVWYDHMTVNLFLGCDIFFLGEFLLICMCR